MSAIQLGDTVRRRGSEQDMTATPIDEEWVECEYFDANGTFHREKISRSQLIKQE